MSLLDVAGAAVDVGTGGVFGAVAGLFTGGAKMYSDYKIAKIEQADRIEQRTFELSKMKQESENMRAEMEANIRVTSIQVQGEVAQAIEETNQAILKTQEDDRANSDDMKYPFLRFIEGARRAVRPLSTYLAWAFLITATVLVSKAYTGLSTGFTPEQVFKLAVYTMETIFFLSVQCITHWFISRGKSAPEFPKL